MTITELDGIFTMLRKQGVRTYSDVAGGGFTVEFFPAVAAEEPAKPSKDDDLCACKHHLHIQHMNGLCVEGCSPEECNPEVKP